MMNKEENVENVEKGYCNFDLIDNYKTNYNDWKNHEVRLSEIDGFKRSYPLPEGVRKINILV